MADNNHYLNSKIYPDDFGRFIGTSKSMLEIYRQIENIAPTDTPVFITGESGTGKEICAEAIHFYSDRRNHPFIAINCAALPYNLIESSLFGHIKGAFTGADKDRKGAIEQAKNGTLFLDEICDMPLDLQAKLLRFTQEFTYQKLGCDIVRQANVRIISATNCDPSAKVEEKLFREDLYYRLHVFPIQMPPLRQRKEDIIDIADYYLARYKKNNTHFSESAEDIMRHYRWPGNIRELKNVIQQITATHNEPIITAAMLPEEIKKSSSLQDGQETIGLNHISLPLWKIERKAIEQAIALCDGSITKAAYMLDISPSTIYRKKQSWDDK